jgi:very-short-patch-repair endonuclease
MVDFFSLTRTAVIVILGLLLIMGLVWLLVWKLGLIKPTARGRRGELLPYRVRPSILSPGEREFFPILRVAVKIAWHAQHTGNTTPPWVFASVRLAEVIEVTASSTDQRSIWQAAFNRITRKQLDFVLCDPDSTRPLLVIELDDRTHQRPERRERDGFIDDACAAAGLPILHITAAKTYNAHALADQIRQSLGSASPALNSAGTSRTART